MLKEAGSNQQLLEDIQIKSNKLFNLKQQEISKQALLGTLSKTTEVQDQCMKILEKLKNDLMQQTAEYTKVIEPNLTRIKESKESLKETLLHKEKMLSVSLQPGHYAESQMYAKMTSFDLDDFPKSPATRN